ncbi:MAG TPA: ABC transporter substrate-binding protein [Candidatus Saccharimonadales bacterium]|jgi:peptide/nickel transport system substrate-binding protein|nr:ABC transporter substrate-binding protein [Candidatus Saccharimonadales bacterium]
MRRWWPWILLLAGLQLQAQPGGELRFCIHSYPRTFNPLLVEDEASETVRYLTGGVLVRMDRITQKLQPELATEWKVSADGKRIRFKLRTGVRYSDGTPFSAADVVYTMQQLMDPALHSATGDAFRSGEGAVSAQALSPALVEISFPAAVANLASLFDTVAIISSKSPQREMAVLGPFYIAERKAGSYILLKRNSNYWKKDANGRPLPYLGAVRLEVEQNREIEALRLQRGEIHLINAVVPAVYDKLSRSDPALVRDAGVSADTEQVWFNQMPGAPIPAYKLAWFTSTNFRRAVSEAINREDMARIAFHGHARPAVGVTSPANRFWFNGKLNHHPYDPDSALRRLKQDGFHMENGGLRDKSGNEVEFSIITNAGNSARETMAAMIQQDLKKIGIHVNVVTIDLPSLLERVSSKFNYEACLLGWINADLDPNLQMNVWLSSADNHQWNPKQSSPSTSWEAEIDRRMKDQASSSDERKRKQAWDRVQQIVWEQEPFIFLVNKDALVGISPAVKNAQPSFLRPQTFWNVEELEVK